MRYFQECGINIGGSKGGGTRDACPPLWVQILSFSCSFQEIFDQIIGCSPHLGGWRPLLWEILDPPLVNNLVCGLDQFFCYILLHNKIDYIWFQNVV